MPKYFQHNSGNNFSTAIFSYLGWSTVENVRLVWSAKYHYIKYVDILLLHPVGKYSTESFPPILASCSSELPVCLLWPDHASSDIGIILLLLSGCRRHGNWPLCSRCHRNCCSSTRFVQVMEMIRALSSQIFQDCEVSLLEKFLQDMLRCQIV